MDSRDSACWGRGCAGSCSPAMPSYLGTLSKEHGAVSDSFGCMHSFDVRHRCPDELSTPIHVVRTSKSITGVVQRGVLMEAAVVLFWIDPHLGSFPRGRLVGSILFAPVEIASGTEARRGQLGHRVGDLCRHRYFCNLPVRTRNSPRHKEGVRANGIALRVSTVTLAAAIYAMAGSRCADRRIGTDQVHAMPSVSQRASSEYCGSRYANGVIGPRRI